MAAENQRAEPDSPAHVQHPHPLRSVKLVTGNAQKINTVGIDVDRHLAGRLHRVGMEERPLLMGDPRQLRNREKRPGLIVGPHRRKQRGVGVDRPAHLVKIEPPPAVHRQILHNDAAALQLPAASEDSGVFDRGGHDLVPVRPGAECGEESGVVALGTAAGEDDFRGDAVPVAEFGAEQFGDLAPGLFDIGGHAAAEVVNARRIAVAFTEKRFHRFEHLGIHPGGCIIIQINDRFHDIHNFLPKRIHLYK